jgi:hypothetical protein
VAVTTVGEVVGFSATALAGAFTAAADVSSVRKAAIFVAAGAVEGGVLGCGQALALRRVPRPWTVGPGFERRRCGDARVRHGHAAQSPLPLSVPTVIAIGVSAGTALLASIGTAQWLVLRRHRLTPAACDVGRSNSSARPHTPGLPVLAD